MKFCDSCGKDTDHLILVENSLGYQYEYLECKKCYMRTVMSKKPISRDDERYLNKRR